MLLTLLFILRHYHPLITIIITAYWFSADYFRLRHFIGFISHAIDGAIAAFILLLSFTLTIDADVYLLMSLITHAFFRFITLTAEPDAALFSPLLRWYAAAGFRHYFAVPLLRCTLPLPGCHAIVISWLSSCSHARWLPGRPLHWLRLTGWPELLSHCYAIIITPFRHLAAITPLMPDILMPLIIFIYFAFIYLFSRHLFLFAELSLIICFLYFSDIAITDVWYYELFTLRFMIIYCQRGDDIYLRFHASRWWWLLMAAINTLSHWFRFSHYFAPFIFAIIADYLFSLRHYCHWFCHLFRLMITPLYHCHYWYSCFALFSFHLHFHLVCFYD